MRLLNFCLVIMLGLAAAYVYEIKFEATVRLTRVVEMRNEVRREQDSIASLRAEWGRLATPARLEELARRYLTLRPAELSQLDSFNQLPERSPELFPPSLSSPSAAANASRDPDIPTGKIRTPTTR